MEKLSYNDQMLIQYLLGAMPEAEAEAFGKHSIVDDEFAARLQEVENDLVDAYVRDELSGVELAQFQSHYLASPRRREKVEIARAFQPLAEQKLMAHKAQAAVAAAAIPVQWSPVEETAPVGQKEKESLWRAVRNFFTVPRLTLQWGFAAAVILMLIVGGWLVFETLRLRNQTSQAQAQLEQQRSAGSETERELERMREQYARLEQERVLEKQRAKSQPPSLPTSLGIVSFELAAAGPRSGRSGNDQIAAVTVPPGTDYVSLQLDLPPNDYSVYRVELLSGKEQIVWRSKKLEARKKEMGEAIDASIRADRLKPQEYVIKVMGISAHGSEELAEYQFRVEK